MRRLTAALALALAALAGAAGSAQTKKPPAKIPAATPKLLRTIGSVVAHSRTPFNSTPAAVKVFPREAYRDQGQSDVPSVLMQTPGGQPIYPIIENAAVRGEPAFASVRGSLPYETAVSIDGVPVSSPLSGAFDLSHVPTFVLQDMEINKGPGDVGGIGPNAIAGSLNLRTAEPTETRRALIEFSANDRGGSFSDLAYGGTMPGGKLAVATMFSVDGSSQWGNTPYPLQDLRRSELMKLRFTPDSAFTLTGEYFATQTAYASAGPTLPSEQNADLALYDLDAQLDRGRDFYSARVYTDSLTCGGTYFDSERISGSRASWDHQIAANHYVASVELRDGSAPGANETDALFNVSAQFHPAKNIEFDAGGGLDRHDAVAQSQSLGGLRAALSFTPTKALAFRASFGDSYAPPPLAARFTPSLFPETALNYDLGAEYRLHGDTTTLSADLYRTNAHNAFAIVPGLVPPVTPTGVQWYNLGSLQNEGFEASIAQFKRVGLGFIAQGALVHTSPMPRSGLQTVLFPGSTTIAIPAAPYAQGYGEISYKWPRGSRASFGALYLGANNPYAHAAFATFNANLELSLAGKSKVQISGENLFNILGSTIVPPLGILGPPETTFVGQPNVLRPRTIRVMFRQSFGAGSVYER